MNIYYPPHKSRGVYEIIFPYIHKLFPDTGKYNTFLSRVVRSIQRNEYNLSIIDKLENENIHCCILKGISVAQYYKNPDYRISSDMDIYIHKTDMRRCIKILKENHFKVEPLGKMYHFEAKHPVGGLIEFHIALHHSSTQKLLFDNQQIEEDFTEFSYGNRKLHMLGVNDNAFYLFAHFVKHFVGFGAGLRQLTDFLLYVNKYYDEINWDKLYKKLDSLSLKVLFNELLGIGVKYFNFDFQNYSINHTERLLEDIENGGLFGFEDMERKDFFASFAAKRTTMQEKDFESFMSKNRKETLLQRLFPCKEKMLAAGYGYKHRKAFLPLLWLERFGTLILDVLSRKKSLRAIFMYKTPQQTNEIIDKRLNLMSDLKII